MDEFYQRKSMKKETGDKLNKLNQEFYHKVAESFSQTRNKPWEGWKRVVELMRPVWSKGKIVRVLDVGCGNGRWGEFLAGEGLERTEYWGVDSGQELLVEAKSRVSGLEKVKLVKADVVEAGWDKKLGVVAYGVMHHIPGRERRKRWMTELQGLVVGGGYVVVSVWKYGRDGRWEGKMLDVETVARRTGVVIEKGELEVGDGFLGWQERKDVARYCHEMSKTEENELINDLQMRLVDKFEADGKTGKMNRYLVLKS